jgi:MFS family permease
MTWPWIFWINLPIGGIALVILLLAWPAKASTSSLTWSALASVDFLGSLLLLAASALLVFALQEAGSYQFAWNSPVIVCCLVFSAVSFVGFAGWQKWLVSHLKSRIKAIFPIETIAQRVIGAGMM